MAPARVMTAAALAALLAGCAPDATLEAEKRALQTEVAELRQKVADEAGARLAEIAYFERQASIAAACDWLFPVCPSSVTETGRQVQERGYGGGADWPFWLAVVLKLLSFGALIGAAFGTLSWAWYRLAMPAKDKAEAAHRAIEQLQSLTVAAEKRVEDAQEKEEAALLRLASAHAELEQLEEAIAKSKREASEAAAKAEELKSVHAALDVFGRL